MPPLCWVACLGSSYRYRCGFDSKYAVTVVEKLHEASQDSLMPNTNVNTVLPANAPKNGVAIASARYKKDRKLWYVVFVLCHPFCSRAKFHIGPLYRPSLASQPPHTHKHTHIHAHFPCALRQI